MKKSNGGIVKRVFKVIGIVILILILLFILLLGFLTITEYKPAKKINLKVNGTAESTAVNRKSTYKIVTWNVGYGALGDNADFFMDGGSHVKTASEKRVKENLDNQRRAIKTINPDFAFLQEVDKSARRSYDIDEVTTLSTAVPDSQYAFAENFKVAFIPYPIPPIGKVDAGIMTMSNRKLNDTTRLQLPCPFKWPVRIGNLKRCLLVSRVKIKGSKHELVLVNLHLEAYDNGEGKAAQSAMLKSVLENEYKKGNYVVAAGDFNQSFSNVDTSMYPKQKGKWHVGDLNTSVFGKGWKCLMDTNVPSCRSLDKPLKGNETTNFQYYMIDGFITSPNVKVKSIETMDYGFKNSDHNPVKLEFKL